MMLVPQRKRIPTRVETAYKGIEFFSIVGHKCTHWDINYQRVGGTDDILTMKCLGDQSNSISGGPCLDILESRERTSQTCGLAGLSKQTNYTCMSIFFRL